MLQGESVKRKGYSYLVVLMMLSLGTIWFGIRFLEDRRYFFISLLLIIYAICGFILHFEGKKPGTGEVMVIAVMAALAVVGRMAFFMVPHFKPMTAVIILCGVCLGPEAGFLVGATATLVSNFFFGQGPWTPWQMFAFGMEGLIGGLITMRMPFMKKRLSLCILGGILALVVYGGIMNPASLLMYSYSITWRGLLAVYISGFPVDLIHALSTVVFLWVGAGPVMEKLERIKKKYGLWRRL